jgi:hypothetical protein
MNKIWFALALAIALAPRPASADSWLRVTGVALVQSWTYIGMHNGVAKVVQVGGGVNACTIWHLGTGGLGTNWRIYGGQNNNWMGVLDTTVTIDCGSNIAMQIRPLVTNGFNIHLHGEDHHDDLYMGSVANFYSELFGWTGSDRFTLNNGGTAWGDSGNDKFFGDKPLNVFRGQFDSDNFCVHSWAQVWEMSGGAQADTRCGTASYISGVEATNCAVCGPGF